MQKIVTILILFSMLAGGGVYLYQQQKQQDEIQQNNDKYQVKVDPTQVTQPEDTEEALEAMERQFVDIENAWREHIVEFIKIEWKFKKEKWDAYLKLREEYQDKKMDFYETLADKMEAEGSQYAGPIEDLLLKDEEYLAFEKDYREKLLKLIGEVHFAQYETIRQDFNIDWEKKVPGEGPVILIEF